MQNIYEEIGKADSELREIQKQYDAANILVRDLIRGAGRLITALHRDDDETDQAMESLKALMSNLLIIKALNENVKLQALQEYAEAYIFYSIKKNDSFPGILEVGVGESAYLLGLMDVVGELKREVLEYLGRSELEKAERYSDLMKSIYDASRSIRYQESILPGFRRKQDVARILLESCMSEILYFKAHAR